MTDVLLVTSSDWPAGEPGSVALDAALSRRGLDARWVCWDDPAVDWAGAGLVAVRSTWDYVARHQEFLGWARSTGEQTRLLNGADVFAWNLDKVYLARFGGSLPVVPTLLADARADLPAAVATFGTAVVKPRVGAGGIGVLVADSRTDLSVAEGGPWVVQPLVESVRTEGETSVFVLGGRAVSQVDKTPAAGEIRVHEHFGGVSRPVELREEYAALALEAMAAAGDVLGTALDYGRVDMMRLADGRLVVSELEVTEPGLYLDVLPANAEPFADLVATLLV